LFQVKTPSERYPLRQIYLQHEGATSSFYSIHLNCGKPTLLDARSVHRIAMGLQFTLYKDKESFLKLSPWGILVVSEVKLFTSVLHIEGTSGIDLVNPGIAVLYGGGMGQALAVLASYEEPELSTTFHKGI
jgi:hypothetical protein